MRIIGQGLGAGLSLLVGLLVIAGCQAEGEKFQVSEPWVVEQAGLSVEPVFDFERTDVLSAQPSNVGGSYVRTGELGFRILRLRNVGNRTAEIYADTSELRTEATVFFDQWYFGICPRTSGLPLCFSAGPRALDISDFITRYRSEFVVRRAAFASDSGGRTPISETPIELGSTPIVLRSGESTYLELAVELAETSPLVMPAASQPVLPGSGRNFGPPEAPTHPEFLIGAKIAVGFPGLRFEFRDPKTDALHPLDVRWADRALTLFYDPKSDPTNPKVFPPANVARTINGLAVQY